MQKPCLFTLSVLTVAAVAAATPGHAQTSAKLAKIKASKTFVIGYRPGYPPFSYTLPNAGVTGYGIEVCQKIAKAVEQQVQVPLTIQYKPVTSKERFAAVADGTIDVECADTTNTKARRQKYGVDFVTPYFITGVNMMVRSDANIDRPAQLNGKTLAYSANTTSEEIAKKYASIWGVKLQPCGPTDADCMRELTNKNVAAWMMDDIALQTARATSKNPKDFKFIGNLLSIEHLAIMYKAGDAEYAKLLNAAMNKLMLGREVRKAYTTWFQNPIPPSNVNLQMAPGTLLLNYMQHPSPDVGEYVVY